MNILLEKHIFEANGRYLADAELVPLDDYFKTYAARLQTYRLLQERSDQLILATLRKMAQTHRHVIQEHSDKCQRDMSYVLRTAALALLKNDEDSFQEDLILWMQNIMRSLHKEDQSAYAYKLLQETIKANMPTENAMLINHYLGLFITALTMGV
jgi:hypothetical protein